MAGMRSLQNLDINLGLFGFPVKVYKATNEPAEGVEFRQLHSECKHPINYIKRCNHCAKDVQQADLLKGREHNGGFLTFTEDEIKALKPERLGVVQVEGYIDGDSISDTYYDGTVYYLSPGGKDPQTFVTFREALQGRMAVGKVVMYGREHVVAIRAVDRLLCMYFIRNHSEIRDAYEVPSYDKIPTTASAEYLGLMDQVMTAKRITFDDVALESDSYVESVKALIAARAAGQPAPQGVTTVVPEATNNLMAMLKASLAAAQA